MIETVQFFEHCPYVWRPTSASSINKLESIQKRGVKWILSDANNYTKISYGTNYHLYLVHCKQLNILPIKFRFDYHDLKMFHSIVNGFSCVKMPDYIKPFQRARLRNSHLDSKFYISSIQARYTNRNFESVSQGNLSQSFFYRTHLLWNRLPIGLREIVRPSEFKKKLIDHLWNNDIKHEYSMHMLDTIDEPEHFSSDHEIFEFG